MISGPGARKRRIVITAGPTRERIDPVRYISNYSTGTFGYELARAARKRALVVTLISGPTALKAPAGVNFVQVESACQMEQAVTKALKGSGYLIMAAAVADWRPRVAAKHKIKKDKRIRTLELVRNRDILARVARNKGSRVIAGFALETENLEKNALKKLKEKNLDLIVANRLSPRSDVFGCGKSSVVMIDRWGNRNKYAHSSKKMLAKIVLDKVLRFNI